jgi:hypothetical protein
MTYKENFRKEIIRIYLDIMKPHNLTEYSFPCNRQLQINEEIYGISYTYYSKEGREKINIFEKEIDEIDSNCWDLLC